MSATGWVIFAIVVGVLAVAAIAAYRYEVTRRTTALRDRFGPEYDRTVGRRRRAVRPSATCGPRGTLRASSTIKPLSDESRARFTEDWDHAERLFVDDPELAAREADRVVRNVLDERGYPNDDLDDAIGGRVGRASTGRPALPARARHGARQRRESGAERTENLRKAMVDFRAVFIEMVESEPEARCALTSSWGRRPRAPGDSPARRSLSRATRRYSSVLTRM